MSIDTLIGTTKEVMAEEIEACCAGLTRTEEPAREEAPEIMVWTRCRTDGCVGLRPL